MFKSLFVLLTVSLPVLGLAGTIPGQALIDFETSSDSTVITPSIMSASTKGSVLSGSWSTTTDPEARTSGTTSQMKISADASYQLYTPADINGTIYGGSGTRGMRETMSANNCAMFTFNTPYPTVMSVGFYFRFNGPAINDSPRDLFMFQDSGGNFQIMQIYDHTGSTLPIVHAHTQNGTGNNVSFQRNHWYWVTLYRTAAGGTMKVSFYDPSNNYGLVGTSTLGVPSGTSGVHWIWFGCSKYFSGGSQSVDYDNLIINTSGVFPLGPGTGGSFPVNQPPVAVANATPRTGTAPMAVTFSSVGSSDPEGGALTYSWSFGDGAVSTASNPSHAYQSAGTYSARLTVSDGTNSTPSSVLTITTTSVQPPVGSPTNLRVVSQ